MKPPFPIHDLSAIKSLIGDIASRWLQPGPFILLIAQNLGIFYKHYFYDFGFPWDFFQAYYAMTAFWTTLWSQGVFPSWVPFYAGGVPFDLLLQTGAQYPPLWIFPLLKIQYTVPAAVIIQCLHVLFGAVGMFFFLKEALPQGKHTRLYAALGAFIFQFFGGFYSNAEHVDIIRAYALTPWLLSIFHLSEGKPFISRARMLLIPLLLMLLVTGAYIGNVISSALIVGFYFLVQLVQLWRKKAEPRDLLRLAIQVGLLVLLGAGMSVYRLGPAAVFGSWLARSGLMETGVYHTIGLEYYPTLFLTNRYFPGEISMSSFYMTLPALLMLTYLPLRWLKEKWPMAAVTLAALALVGGPASFVWAALSRVFPVLLVSRFPSSDYRAFLIIGLIYFAMLAARSFVEGEVSWRSFILRTVLAYAWFVPGLFIVYPDLLHPAALAAAVFAVSLLLLLVMMRWPFRLAVPALLLLLVIVTGLDAVRVLNDMELNGEQSTWEFPGASSIYKSANWRTKKDGRLRIYSAAAQPPESRPARNEEEWEGFITGNYTFPPSVSFYQLRGNLIVKGEPVFQRYMLQQWLPLFFPKEAGQGDGVSVSIPPAQIAEAIAADPPAYVSQTRYGLDTVEYEVSLPEPMLMVENENYFPGWTAQLRSAQGSRAIPAVIVDKVFRGWQLPAGEYRMTAQFHLPGAEWFRGLSLAALGIWLALSLYGLRGRLTRDSALKAGSK